VFGLPLVLSTHEPHDVIMYREMVERQGYEPGTTRLIRGLISGDRSFVDVGANNGYFPVAAASVAGVRSRIFAFEPYLPAFSRLEQNVARCNLSSRVTTVRAAVSNHNGVGTLHLSRIEDGRNSLVADFPDTQEVKCVTLDTALRDVPVSLVKIDVEGAELAVVEGMNRILEEQPDLIVILEWNRNYSSRALWQTLKQRFDLFEIRESRTGTLLRECMSPPGGILNILGVAHGTTAGEIERTVSLRERMS